MPMPLSSSPSGEEQRMEDVEAGIMGAPGGEGDGVPGDPGSPLGSGPLLSPHDGTRSQSSEKIRVIVMAGGDGQIHSSSVGKALIVNTSGKWTEFLESAARKLGLPSVDKVQTLQGDVVEQLDEILQGDRLIVSAKASPKQQQQQQQQQQQAPNFRPAVGGAGYVDPHEFVRAHTAASSGQQVAKPAAHAMLAHGAGQQNRPMAGAAFGMQTGLGASTGCTLNKGMQDMGNRLIGMVDGSDGPSAFGAGRASLTDEEGGLAYARGGWGGNFSEGQEGNHQFQQHPQPQQSVPPRFVPASQGGGMMMMAGNNPYAYGFPPPPTSQQQQQGPSNFMPANVFFDQQQQQQQQLLPTTPFQNQGIQNYGMPPPHPRQDSAAQWASIASRRQEQAQAAIAQLQQQAAILSAKIQGNQQRPVSPAQQQPSKKKSHEQARFSPLVQVLRDNLVEYGTREVGIGDIELGLNTLLGTDWKQRLAVLDTLDYVHEAAQAGLVDVGKNEIGGALAVSVRGSRQIGVVKWVKESYGFIQSAMHSEDLFYHSSEVRANRLIEAKDEVEFLVVRNPFTGKLNATQIYLIRPDDPGRSSLHQTSSSSSSHASGITQEQDRSNAMSNNNSDVSMAAIALMACPPPFFLEEQQHHASSSNLHRRQELGYANALDEGAHLADRMSSMSLTSQEREAVGRARRGSHSSRSHSSRRQDGDNSDDLDLDMDTNSSPREPNKEPWLYKTKTCKYWPQCPRGSKCWFAHGDEELRKPNSAAFMLTDGQIGGDATEAAFNFNLFSAVAGAAEFTPGGGGADSKRMKIDSVYNEPVQIVPQVQQAAASTGGGNLPPDVNSTDAPRGMFDFAGLSAHGFFEPCPDHEEGLGSDGSSIRTSSSPDDIPWGNLGM